MKRRLVYFISLILTLIAITSVVMFASYAKTLGGTNLNHTLGIGDFRFLMNGEEYKENVSTISFTLNKGDSLDFDFKLQAESASSGVLKYSFITKTNDTDLTKYKAIDVFETKDDKTVYVSSLYDYLYNSNTSNVIEGFLGAGDTDFIKLSLVYSLSASTIYENQNLNLIFEATPELVSSDAERQYAFAGDSDSLKTAIETGKTVILTKDIIFKGLQISEDVYYDLPVSNAFGLDLNGHTLTLEKSIIINMPKQEALNYDLKIYNSSNTGSIISNNNSNIVINYNSSDNYLIPIDDSIDANSKITHSNLTNTRIATYIQTIIDKASLNTFLYDDIFSLKDELGYYSSLPTPFLVSLTSGSNFTTLNGERLIFKNKLNTENTRFDKFELSISGVTVSANFTIRGNGTLPIFEYYINMIPEYINSNMYLPVYDQATGAKLTWVSSDTNIFSSDGVLLPNGLPSLENYLDKTVDVGLILELAGQKSYYQKQRHIEVMSAEERFDRLYKYDNLYSSNLTSITNGVVTNAIDFTSNFNLTLENIEKYGIESITIDLSHESNIYQVKDNQTFYYLELLNDDLSRSLIANESYHISNEQIIPKDIIVNVLPDNGKNKKIQITYTLKFKDDETKVYTYNDEIVLIGQTTDSAIVDIGPEIQEFFTNIVYLGKGNYFYKVDAQASNGDFIHYEVQDKFKEFVSISDSVMVSDENGPFILYLDENNVEKYGFIGSTQYKLVNGEYQKILDDNYNLDRYALIDGAYYLIDNTKRYNREVSVIINKDKLPPVNIEALIDAYIYDNTLDFSTLNKQDLTKYVVKFDIDGIYHNNQNEIADTTLYIELLKQFDTNNDGFIQVNEASKANVSINASNVTSLKGLEYFTNLSSLRLTNSTFNDLSFIEGLYELTDISFANNYNLSNIHSLQYMDKLKHLDLSNCNITSVEPLRYLKQIENINLNNNRALDDIEPLTTNITTLRVLNLQSISPKFDTNQSEDYTYFNYLLSSIVLNNPNINQIFSTTYINNFVDSCTVGYRAGAYALSKLVTIDKIKGTLYLPLSFIYNYNGTPLEFRIIYSAYDNPNNNISTKLLFETDSQGLTTSYSITNANVSSITLKMKIVCPSNNSFSTNTDLSRDFDVRILESNSYSNLMVEIGSTIKDASLYFTDYNLREYLSRNYANSSNVIDASTLNNTTSLDLSNLNIKSLNGLDLFSNLDSLNLRGNTFETNEFGKVDLSFINGLPNITTLYLDSNDFDFSKISSVDVNTNGSYTFNGKRNLQNLYVNGSLNMDNEETLNCLYQVYLANTNGTTRPNIYIKDEIWDPYKKYIDIYKGYLPSLYSVMHLNDYIDIYSQMAVSDISNITQLHPFVKKNGNDCFFEFDFYGFKYQFRVTEAYQIEADSGTNNHLFDQSNNSYLKYSCLNNGSICMPDSDTISYIKYSLTGLDACAINVSEDFTNTATVFVKFDTSLKIRENNQTYTLLEYFTGRDLRRAVINAWMSNNTYKDRDILEDYEIKYLTLSNPTNNQNYETSAYFIINGAYDSQYPNASAIKNLSKTSVDWLKFNRDFYIGDGSEFVKISKLYIDGSYIDLSTLNVDLNIPELKLVPFNNNPITFNDSYSDRNFGVNFYDKTYIHTVPSQIRAIIPEVGSTCQITEYVDYLMMYYARSIAESNQTNKQTIENEIFELSKKKDVFYLGHITGLYSIDFYSSNITDWTFLIGLMSMPYFDKYSNTYEYYFENQIEKMYGVKTPTHLDINGRFSNDNTLTIKTQYLLTILYNGCYGGTWNPEYYFGTLDNQYDRTTPFDPSKILVRDDRIIANNTIEYAKDDMSSINIDYIDMAIDIPQSKVTENSELIENDNYHYLMNPYKEVMYGNYIFLPKYWYDYSASNNLSETDQDYHESYKRSEITYKIIGNGDIGLYNTLFDGLSLSVAPTITSGSEVMFDVSETIVTFNSRKVTGYFVKLNDIGYDFFFMIEANVDSNSLTTQITAYANRTCYTGAIYDSNGNKLYDVTESDNIYTCQMNNTLVTYYSPRNIKDLPLREMMVFGYNNYLTSLVNNNKNGANSTNTNCNLPGSLYMSCVNIQDSKTKFLGFIGMNCVDINVNNNINTILFKYPGDASGVAYKCQTEGKVTNPSVLEFMFSAVVLKIKNQLIDNLDFLTNMHIRRQYIIDTYNRRYYYRPGGYEDIKYNGGYGVNYEFENNIITDIKGLANTPSNAQNPVEKILLSNNAIEELHNSSTLYIPYVKQLSLNSNYLLDYHQIASINQKIVTQLDLLGINSLNHYIESYDDSLIKTLTTFNDSVKIKLRNAFTVDSNGSMGSSGDMTVTVSELKNILNLFTSNKTEEYNVFLDSTIDNCYPISTFTNKYTYTFNGYTISIEFCDSNLINAYSLIGDAKCFVEVIVKKGSSQLCAFTKYVNVRFGGSSPTVIVAKTNGIANGDFAIFAPSELDPALYSYFLAKRSTNANTLSQNEKDKIIEEGSSYGINSTNLQNYYVTYIDNGNINDLGSNKAMTSLKGIDKLKWFRHLTIKKSNIMEVGWTNTLNSLDQKFTLQYVSLKSSQAIEMLEKMPNVKQLDWNFYSVKFREPNNNGKTLAMQIGMLSNLNNVILDYTYDFIGVYDNDPYQNVIKHLDDNSLMFNTIGKAYTNLSDKGCYALFTYPGSARNITIFPSYSLGNDYVRFKYYNGDYNPNDKDYTPKIAKNNNSTISSIDGMKNINERIETRFDEILFNITPNNTNSIYNGSYFEFHTFDMNLDGSLPVNALAGYKISLPLRFSNGLVNYDISYSGTIFGYSWQYEGSQKTIIDSNMILTLDQTYVPKTNNEYDEFTLKATIMSKTLTTSRQYIVRIYNDQTSLKEDNSNIYEDLYYMELDVTKAPNLTPLSVNGVEVTRNLNGLTLKLYDASEIFKSKALYANLFKGAFSYQTNEYFMYVKTKNYDYVRLTKDYGVSYLKYEDNIRITGFNLGYLMYSPYGYNINQFYNNLDGLQYFYSLNDITICDNQTINLSSLSNIKLKSLTIESVQPYSFVNTQEVVSIFDFSFLDNSKDTLEVLKINSTRILSMDYSWILEFTNLKTIIISYNNAIKQTKIDDYIEALTNQMYANSQYHSGVNIIKEYQTSLDESYAYPFVSDFTLEGNCLIASGVKDRYLLPSYIEYNGNRLSINYEATQFDGNILSNELTEYNYDTLTNWYIVKPNEANEIYLTLKINVNGLIIERALKVKFIS